MANKEFHIRDFIFTWNFDSGNLGLIEEGGIDPPPAPKNDLEKTVLPSDKEQPESLVSCPAREPRPSTSTLHSRSVGIDPTDFEFRLWTRPDCKDTEFENGNRTWFYFGLRGGPPGSIVQFNVMNLNKQAKLFSQGMAPVFLAPGKSQWERIRDPPTYQTIDNNFAMSFKFRNSETPSNGTTYFAFTYPYTYRELQQNLDKLSRRYANGHKSKEELTALGDSTVYFHRENVVSTLEGRRLDLLTITSVNGITNRREPKLKNLFLHNQSRAHVFDGKKVVFISSRVHPGETCSSFVMNGLLKFLLRDADPRVAALRKKYVFKLIPMLNPDGVVNGHYRTDTRGVNLNRVYSRPSLSLHPTIYAARKLILYAHLGHEVEEGEEIEEGFNLDNLVKNEATASHSVEAGAAGSAANRDDKEFTADVFLEMPRSVRGNVSSRSSSSSRVSNISLPPVFSPHKVEPGSQWYEMTENSRFSEGDESIADFSIPPDKPPRAAVNFSARNQDGLDNLEENAGLDSIVQGGSPYKAPSNRTSFLGALPSGSPRELFKSVEDDKCSYDKSSLKVSNDMTGSSDIMTSDFRPTFPIDTGKSGLFMYIDIHGHASKRGIFMYGNHITNLETKIDALLYPKLMSYNNVNFDFPACNFTERNMYLKDRHTGAGREGSGRVSIYKATGVTYCYTLECNFNTGRVTNLLPAASRDLGRASPPLTYDIPPKYNPSIYEDTGKSLLVSILDLTESNPWTRLTCSSCKNLKGVRGWIRSYLKTAAESETSSGKASKIVKASPIRTRLRSVAGLKKSAIKQLKLSKSPSSPEMARSLSKISRKALVSKNSQSVPGKLTRQLSQGTISPFRPNDSPGRIVKKRIGSAHKKKKAAQPSPGSSKPYPCSDSKSSSRASSPRRTKGAKKSAKKLASASVTYAKGKEARKKKIIPAKVK